MFFLQGQQGDFMVDTEQNYTNAAPASYDGRPLPTVVACGGMDAPREIVVAREGDAFLARGFAVLSFDGPGQGESPIHGLYVTPTNLWSEDGDDIFDSLLFALAYDALINDTLLQGVSIHYNRATRTNGSPTSNARKMRSQSVDGCQHNLVLGDLVGL